MSSLLASTTPVAIQPGCTEFAVTPPRALSCASARIIPSIAALAVE